MLRNRLLSWGLASCMLLMSGCGWKIINTSLPPCNRADIAEQDGQVVITKACWNWILLQFDSYKKGQNPA